jgi:polyisoprenoid-binding protein YceI
MVAASTNDEFAAAVARPICPSDPATQRRKRPMTTWNLDTAHTQVSFSAKHMMVTTVRGVFHDVSGTIELDETDPTNSRGEFRVAAASVDTNFDARDNHLRSADFFDAATYPDITFRSTSIAAAGKDRYTVTGDLTIKDVTAPATFQVELEGIVPGMSGARHAGLSVTGTIQRETWGLNWNVALEQGGWLVGKDIKLEIAIAADEVAVTEGELATAAS